MSKNTNSKLRNQTQERHKATLSAGEGENKRETKIGYKPKTQMEKTKGKKES